MTFNEMFIEMSRHMSAVPTPVMSVGDTFIRNEDPADTCIIHDIGTSTVVVEHQGIHVVWFMPDFLNWWTRQG